MSSILRLSLASVFIVGALLLVAWFDIGSSNDRAKGTEPGSETGGPAQPNGGNNGTLDDLASRCAQSVGEDGFGEVSIEGRLIVSNETGEILVPCRVRLERGGHLQLNNVKLRSKHLVISDYEPNGKTRVRFNNSDLIASGKFGFLLQLSDAEDSVAVHRSTLNYPLSVWVRISGQAQNSPGGGRIEVKNSTARAADPESEDGIQFVAGEIGGKAEFNKLTLDTGKPEGEYQNALLFAGDCKTKQVEGFPNRCGPEAMLQGLR